eukprot:CAMPEP_0201547270 /NCGR_PEP_ID=MMETSP0173_2-20130828/3738_1 /ASSEMBLY_ACC=CAM_ASM_000268 /TAXON_ID=218659 /ORGANISM="Vexillifera sp., Strain DIVA3 564/2" /LENGTH=140 /DNA_ID=CAMNT_0047956265 /DNA_START=678 /DNA_END=1096 /DNA_ORIENTATION=+
MTNRGIFEKAKETIIEKYKLFAQFIAQLEIQFCITTCDTWTRKGKRFFSLTCSYINHNWQWSHVIVAIEPWEPEFKHTAPNVNAKYEKLWSKYLLGIEILSCVGDSASNNGVLNWWERRVPLFPDLQKIARKYLTFMPSA